MKTPLKRIILFITLLVLTAGQTQAAFDPTTVQKLLTEDGASSFGHSVSLSADGSIALIGDISDNTGAAYVFTRAADGSWIQQAKLTAEDGAWDDRFGASVSLSPDGGTALIGAYGDDDKGSFSGSAYVFTRAADGNWSQQAKLTAEDGATPDSFGDSVFLSADGNIALIGAPLKSSTYVFTRATDGSWSQQNKLTATFYLGSSVSLTPDGSIALIGAAARESAYVFTHTADGSWSQQAKLIADDSTINSHFGSSVSLSADGNIALIGAVDNSSAYVFSRAADGSWSQQDKLTAAHWFGHSVSLSADGSIALIGAPGDDDKGKNTGSAYVFTRSVDGSWSQQNKLTAYDGASNDLFGWSVSLSADGGIALIGARGHDSAYVFSAICGQGRNLPANTWLMTAPSCQPANPPGAGIAAQYGDDLSPAYATNWIGWKWDATAQDYPPAMAATDPLVLGDGNWVYSKTAGRLNLSGTATSTTDCAAYGGSGQCFAIDLAIPLAGVNFWNMVGHPFPYAVNWADVQVAVSSDGGATWGTYSPSTAEIAGYVSKIYYRWNGNSYDSYDDSTPGSLGVLQPQESVWVRSLGSYSGPVPQKLKLLIPVR